jgi:hypothetical protein
MTDYNGPNRRAPVAEGWHLDKKVPLSLIAAMIAQVVIVTMFFADIKRDVELLKQDVLGLHTRDTAIELQTREYVKSLNDSISRIDGKLDRLIERGK